jgi:light-regulated signal transduction histidine kinase (bacteriophytochrome)
LLSYALQRVLSRPIDALTDVARRITQSRDFSVRAAPVGVDEIAELAAAFNVMLAAVEERQQAIQQHARELEARVDDRTAELRQAYRELEAFSYSVSHDLRSPLRTITGFAEMLLEDSDNRLSGDSVQHMQRIIAASARMNRLIDGLLDFSRVSKRELQLEPIDLGAMARDVIDELAADASGRKVEFSVATLHPCVGDPTLIRQVLVNLVSNALKYTREREVAVITISEHPSNDATHQTYLVRDNGAGFEMEHATRLFQVFERLHDQRRFEGTGIGLATTKRIIERHGGRIWAESSPEHGATFYFTLPAATRS